MTFNLLPIVLTINEERFIRQCLMPLANIFPVVIVADTGSTDNNLAEIAKVHNVYPMNSGILTLAELGQKRAEMAHVARDKFGASHVMHIDGDEIYTTGYLRYIWGHPLPEGMAAGYTYGIELDELPNGEIWSYDADYNRCAVFSVDAKWHGAYPFEAPDAYQPDNPAVNFYWNGILPSYHFYHMHHLRRSSKDAETRYRLEKKQQFAMVDKPERKPVNFILPSWDNYKDVDE